MFNSITALSASLLAIHVGFSLSNSCRYKQASHVVVNQIDSPSQPWQAFCQRLLFGFDVAALLLHQLREIYPSSQVQFYYDRDAPLLIAVKILAPHSLPASVINTATAATPMASQPISLHRALHAQPAAVTSESSVFATESTGEPAEPFSRDIQQITFNMAEFVEDCRILGADIIDNIFDSYANLLTAVAGAQPDIDDDAQQ